MYTVKMVNFFWQEDGPPWSTGSWVHLNTIVNPALDIALVHHTVYTI
jgi:hypothetical protein